MSTEGKTCDERGHGVRLKVNPNVRIPGTVSEFLRDSTNKMELFKYLTEEVMQRSYSEIIIMTATYNGTTVRHVIHVVETSKEPVCPRVELIFKIIIILLIIFLGFIKSKTC